MKSQWNVAKHLQIQKYTFNFMGHWGEPFRSFTSTARHILDPGKVKL